MLSGKTIVLGVSSSISAYKAADLTSRLKKLHADVHVILTENAAKLIGPIIFETLTGHKCLIDTFDRNFEFKVEHVELAKAADLMLVAPATANVCAKFAHGLADDMLTTTVLACDGKKMLAPAMNTRMYDNPVTQDNLKALRAYGWEIIEPADGHLACGDNGKGKLADVETIVQRVTSVLCPVQDLKGLRVLVTAGATQEALDPVRYITNHSSGKMGYALAEAAQKRGARVTLVSGHTALDTPAGVERITITGARDLFEAVTERSREQDIIIAAAAVADYRPAQIASEKIHKADDDMVIRLERTEDTLQYLGDHKPDGQVLCGFAMETSDMVERAKHKLTRKNLDMICANNVKVKGAGFAGDTNVITMISAEETQELPLMSKRQAADRILDALSRMVKH